jgi:hypothetical protein
MRKKWDQDFQWTVHNMIAHPIMQVLSWFGYSKLGDRLHDATVPRSERGRIIGEGGNDVVHGMS